MAGIRDPTIRCVAISVREKLRRRTGIPADPGLASLIGRRIISGRRLGVIKGRGPSRGYNAISRIT